MKPLFNNRIQRSTTFVVLMLWTFAMASGVANACLLEGRDAHPHDHVVQTAKATFAPDLHHEHKQAPMGADHAAADASKAPCQKFCSDGSKAMTKQHFSLDQPNLRPAPLVVVLWVGTNPSGQDLMRMDAMQPLGSPLPLRLRYARLAL